MAMTPHDQRHDPAAHPTAEIPITQPVPVSRGPAHAIAEVTSVDAVTQVINKDAEALVALIDKMTQLGKDHAAARDRLARQINEEIVQIHATAEVAKEHTMSKDDRGKLLDMLASLNDYYAKKIVEAGYEGPEYVNVSRSRTALQGNVRKAFARSLEVLEHQYQSDAEHIRALWEAMEKQQEKVLRQFESSGVDLDKVAEKLGRIKGILRDTAQGPILVAAPVERKSDGIPDPAVAPVPTEKAPPTGEFDL